eukprot:symbB.v1.2.020516.t1/scaffold1734.1/size154044/1
MYDALGWWRLFKPCRCERPNSTVLCGPSGTRGDNEDIHLQSQGVLDFVVMVWSKITTDFVVLDKAPAYIAARFASPRRISWWTMHSCLQTNRGSSAFRLRIGAVTLRCCPPGQ